MGKYYGACILRSSLVEMMYSGFRATLLGDIQCKHTLPTASKCIACSTQYSASTSASAALSGVC